MSMPDAEPQTEDGAGNVLIHVRYWPNAEIMSIDRLPAWLGARQWLDLLLDGAAQYYQTFAGGRGFFRIPRHRFEMLLAQAAPMAAE